MLVLEKTDQDTLSGKTGWVFGSKPDVGWWVGFLEQNNNTFIFAVNLDMPDESYLPLRIKISKSIFNLAG